MDRRRDVRHEVALPVVMEWGGGCTKDMSVSGAYIETNTFDVPVGQKFDFSVTVGQPESSWTIRCLGLVIRVENQGDRVGVAASIDRFVEISSHMTGREKYH